MSTFSDLTHLDVSHNKIELIPDEYCALTSLQELILIDNKISKFPKGSNQIKSNRIKSNQMAKIEKRIDV
jgi:Leucine-rich repeat (LRR) protein